MYSTRIKLIHMIVASDLTDERGSDGALAPTSIGQTGHIDLIVADKGCDQIGVYGVAQAHLKQGGKIMIHPRGKRSDFHFRRSCITAATSTYQIDQ